MFKKNTFYFVTLILLGCCWIFLKYMEKDKETEFFEKREELVFPHFKMDQVGEIELELPGQRLKLLNEEDEWVLEPNLFPANQVYVKVLLREIKFLTYGDLISKRVEDHPKYKLDAQSRLAILRSTKGEEMARVYVGKPGENFRTIFYRLANDERVFHTVSDLYPALTRTTWYNRSIWMVPISSGPEIKLVWQEIKDHIIYQDGEWINQWTRIPDPEKIKGILSLQGNQPEDKRADYIKREPDGVLTLTTGPVTMSLNLYQDGEHISAMRSDQKSLVYQLPDQLIPPYKEQ